jgi:hypothetical protein
MDARLQSMEGRLNAVDSIKEKVTALEGSTGELGAQQDTLSSAVEHIDLAQTQFTAAADKAAAESQNIATTSSSPTTVLRFTPAEIAQRRKDNKCFHCDEFFIPGHKQHCKQLFVMEVIQGDGDSGDQGLYSVEPTISIVALTDIQPRTGRTMQVYITIQGAVLRALLDFGSTHNFVDSEATAHVGIKFSSRAGFSVAVANGDRVASSGSCKDLKINIAGKPFIIACYGLSLGSYEMILDVQWLESLGPAL